MLPLIMRLVWEFSSLYITVNVNAALFAAVRVGTPNYTAA